MDIDKDAPEYHVWSEKKRDELAGRQGSSVNEELSSTVRVANNEGPPYNVDGVTDGLRSWVIGIVMVGLFVGVLWLASSTGGRVSSSSLSCDYDDDQCWDAKKNAYEDQYYGSDAQWGSARGR